MSETTEYVHRFAIEFEKRYGFPWTDGTRPTPPDYDEWTGRMWADEMRRRGIDDPRNRGHDGPIR